MFVTILAATAAVASMPTPTPTPKPLDIVAERMAPGYGLPAIHMPVAPRSDAAERIHHRLTGTMTEIAPIDGSGLRFAAGTRMYSCRKTPDATGDIARDMVRGAQILSRAATTSMTARAGIRRFNPAATIGYAITPAEGLEIGVEGGAAMGRSFNTNLGLPRYAVGYQSTAFHPAAVANLVVGLRF